MKKLAASYGLFLAGALSIVLVAILWHRHLIELDPEGVRAEFQGPGAGPLRRHRPPAEPEPAEEPAPAPAASDGLGAE